MKLIEKTVKNLDKILWKHFSIFIRRRDNFTCFTCNKCYPQDGTGEYDGYLNAGHFIPRNSKAIKFDERNVNCQCVHCNKYLSSNPVIYRIKMIEKYGIEVVEEFESIKAAGVPYFQDKWSLIEKIKYYREKNKE